MSGADGENNVVPHNSTSRHLSHVVFASPVPLRRSEIPAKTAATMPIFGEY
jgi:hypothetical protein